MTALSTPVRWGALFGLLLVMPAVATAQGRDYCPDRPGLDTPPCTIDAGRLSIEASAADWTHDRTDGTVADTLLIGDLALRYGIADHAELRMAWTPWGVSRSRDVATGLVSRLHGAGDVTIGVKRNLVDPDGSRFSVAVLPSITLPTGGSALGAGDWGAALLLPVGVPLGGPLTLMLTPEVDAATDADGHGRHFAFGSAADIGIAAGDRVSFALEGAIRRDQDPAGASTPRLLAASVAVKIDAATQLDLGGQVGIGGGAPDRRLAIGIARRF